MKPSLRREFIILFVIACTLYFPFINQAISIDAEMLVHTARQMLIDPIDPPIGEYGQHMAVHNHTRMPETSVFYRTGHPPLLAYILAPVAAMAGQAEWPYHAALFLAYLASILAMRRFLSFFLDDRLSFYGTLLWTASPVVVINSHAIMWDLPLTALLLWAFVFFIQWLQTRAYRPLLWSGVLTGLAALTKTNSLPFYLAIGILLLYKREIKALLIWSLPATALPCFWVLHNLLVYGQIQYLSIGWLNLELGNLRYRYERNIGYFGGIILLPPFWYWIMTRAPRIKWELPTIGVLAAIWSILLITVLHKPLWFGITYGLFAVPGLWLVFRQLLPLLTKPLGAHKDEDLLVLVFSSLYLLLLFLMPSANCRYILPLVPMLLLTALRFLTFLSPKELTAFLITCMAITLPFSTLLSIGDVAYPNADRKLPEILNQKGYAPENTWYFAKISMDYYLHQAGYQHLYFPSREPKAGDFAVEESYPGDYALSHYMRGYKLDPIDSLDLHYFPLRTFGKFAGFYGHDRLPYTLNFKGAVKSFRVYRVLGRARLKKDF